VTPHHQRHAVVEIDTFDDLIQFWESLDQPLTHEELRERRHPRTPQVVVVARLITALVMMTIVAGLPTLLRAVGGALA
jgi:hypothetical protein